MRAFATQLASAVESRRLTRQVEVVDQLGRADELRNALLAAVSHDLRTPLASIKASASSLLATDVAWSAEAVEAFASAIVEETDRLTRLVENLLDMSRLRAGAVEVRRLSVGPEEIVPAALESMGDAGAAPRGRVLDVPETLPRVDTDPALVERALANLVANALAWSPEGSPVRIEAGAVGHDLHLRVIDRGPGVPRDGPRADLPALPAARRPFERRGRWPGPGRGAGVRRGGRRRALGRGHARRRHHDGHHAAARVPGGTRGGGARMNGVERADRVLVVDDERPIRRALAANLKARGYLVDQAGSGEEALDLATRDHPDVVVLDLGLPGIDGVEVIEGLRGWSRVPIIVLSARDAEAAKIAALDAGADDYVTKPFGMGELLARVRAALRRTVDDGGDATVVTPDFTVDLAAKRVHRDGGEVHLTPTEWHVLEVLVRSPGRLVSQRQLLQEVWGPQYGTETNYLRLYLAQLRRKLEPEPSRPRYLLTEPGMGYRFEPASSKDGPAAMCARPVLQKGWARQGAVKIGRPGVRKPQRRIGHGRDGRTPQGWPVNVIPSSPWRRARSPHWGWRSRSCRVRGEVHSEAIALVLAVTVAVAGRVGSRAGGIAAALDGRGGVQLLPHRALPVAQDRRPRRHPDDDPPPGGRARGRRAQRPGRRVEPRT